MTTKQSFTPYAQKAILNESFLPDTVNGSISSNLPLLIHAQIADFGSEAINKMIDDINNNLDQLARKMPNFYSEDCDCVINQQPFWNMEEPLVPSSSNQPSNVSPQRCAEYNHEPLAYYAPAHNLQAGRYGIHILQEGVALVAQKIIEKCPKQPREKIILAAFYKLYAHEVAHGWIEDLVCLIDAATNEQALVENRAYKVTQRRYNSYIYMEEAICNTAAYGWLRHFLDGEEVLEANDLTLLEGFGAWMRKQPKGYGNFSSSIESVPYLSHMFIENVYLLLKYIYKPNANNQVAWSDTLIAKTISTYFGGQLSYDGKCWITTPYFQEQCLGSDNIPVHIEGCNALLLLEVTPIDISKTTQPIDTSTLIVGDSTKKWLHSYGIYKYEALGAVINVQQNVVLSGFDEENFPVRFGVIDGDFYLQDCPNLTSFENCPDTVTGTFYASNLPKITTIGSLFKKPLEHIHLENLNDSFFDLNGIDQMIKLNTFCFYHTKAKVVLPHALQMISLKTIEHIKTNVECLEIIHSYFKHHNKHDFLMDCAVELIDAGFEKAAEL